MNKAGFVGSRSVLPLEVCIVLTFGKQEELGKSFKKIIREKVSEFCKYGEVLQGSQLGKRSFSACDGTQQ